MKEYLEYKRWWLENQAHHQMHQYYSEDPEEAFEYHINHLNLYDLMETLVAWDEE